MLVLKLLLSLLTLLPTDARWQRIETDQHISFLFPNNVQKLQRKTNGIPSYIYQTKDLTCVFGVVCSDFSNQKISFSDPNNALAIYEQLKKGSVDMETAILKNEQTVPYELSLIHI